jgi:phytoene/squalene synthetase
MADTMRKSSVGATADLPPPARGGVRAMAASYFEIAVAIRRNHGEVDARGIKVNKGRRLVSAAKAFWLGLA